MSAVKSYISAIVFIGKRDIEETTKRIICNDGFSFSVQASERHYCSPRSKTGPWESFEVGYPTQNEPLLLPYLEPSIAAADALKGVYPYVPADIVDKVISLHGGFHTYYAAEHPILSAFSMKEIAAATGCEITTACGGSYAANELMIPLADSKFLYLRQGDAPRDREIQILDEDYRKRGNPDQLQLQLSV
jgi:hypothetical protein